MTNKEIAENIVANVQKNVFFNSTKECIDSAMEMADFKDNQIKEVLDKSYEWRKQNCRNEISFADCTNLIKWIEKSLIG